MTRRTLPLIVVLAMLGGGCGDGFTLQFGGLDVRNLETQILLDLEEQMSVDLREVECDRGVRPRAGDVFACRAYAEDDGSVGLIEVTQADDQGGVTWELVDVLVPAEQ